MRDSGFTPTRRTLEWQLIVGLRTLLALALLFALPVNAQSSSAESLTPVDENVIRTNRSKQRDPLHQRDIQRILNSIERKSPRLAQKPKSARRQSLIPEEPVLLLIEKRPVEVKGQPPQSDVYYYDYQKDRAIHCIVDPETGEIHRQAEVPSLQLPLVDDEVNRAFEIYLQSRHRGDLAQAYQDATGQALVDLRKVNFKAYTFHGSENESALNKRSRRCGKTRCAQILLYTEDNIALNLSPVINLSRAKVVQANTLPALSDQAMGTSHMDHALPHAHEQ